MSESKVEVVRIRDLKPHPNADTLDVCTIHGGYPVIVKRGQFQEGDLAVYFPVDSTRPDCEAWDFLGKQRRVRAKRLRGVFSMGLLEPNLSGHVLGADVTEEYGVRRWDDIQNEMHAYDGASRTDGLEVPAPSMPLPEKYDLEGWRKYGLDWFPDPHEWVVIHEKIHGQNFRAVYWDGRLHVGSRTRWLAYVDDTRESTWSKVAKRYDLETKLKACPGVVLFGEAYGNNSDMPYGVCRHETGDALAIFDVWWDGSFFPLQRAMTLARGLELESLWAPELYRGPLHSAPLAELAEGPSTMPGANHVREGFVIRSLRGPRKVLKMQGHGYLTRKGG